MKRSELRWILLYSLLLAVVTTTPYVIGFLAEDEQWLFSGFVFGADDGNSYIAKMLLGSTGSWLFRTPYTTVEQRGVLIYLPHILLGKLASGEGLHEQLIALYHLLRILATPFAVYATYIFISLFVKKLFWRRWATILATAGGGMGWILIVIGDGNLFGSLPLDWISPEAFGFLSFYGLPHLILARGLLLLVLANYLSSPFAPKKGWIGGLWLLGLGFIHPLSLITAYAMLLVHQLGSWIVALLRGRISTAIRWFKAALRAGLPSLPLTAYLGYFFLTDPFLTTWTSQNRILSPQPIHLLLAYGLFLIPALVGIKPLLRGRRWTGLLLVAWLAAFPLISYASPVLQRRLPEGIWVVWSITSAMGLGTSLMIPSLRRKILGLALLGLALSSAVMLLISGARFAQRKSMPVFRPADEVALFTWLRENAERDAVLLSSFAVGNAAPAWARVRVVVGHGPETAYLYDLLPKVETFYRGEMDDIMLREFFDQQSIDYVFWGPIEQSMGRLDLMALPSLELAHREGEFLLFEVVGDM